MQCGPATRTRWTSGVWPAQNPFAYLLTIALSVHLVWGGGTLHLCPEWPEDSGWPTTSSHCHSAGVTDRRRTHVQQRDTVVVDHCVRNVYVAGELREIECKVGAQAAILPP